MPRSTARATTWSALTIDRHGVWHDRGGRPIGLTGATHVLRSCDVVLPAVHGPHGEDGTLAALCDLAGLPYVGSGVRAGALAMDKWATKLVAGAVGVATVPGVLLTAATAPAYSWTHPVVVKPVAAGSSHGVSLVRDAAELGPALDAALALDGRILVEDLVEGREIDIAVLARPDGARLVSPALEIVVDGVFDHATKYGGTADFRIPAPLAEAPAKELADAAVAVFDALGCSGLARVDFFLTESGLAAQRGQHDARLHRGVAGSEDVRGRRTPLPRAPGPPGPGRPVNGRIAGLDVIRGVAIGLVMLRHAAPDLFAGAGVVGVVMFFALSGYLITGLLLGELEANGRIDLGRFYRRRVRRLVPALVLLVVGIVVVTLALDPIGDRAELTKTVLVALTWTGNLPFGHASDATFHLWTLATEEQFYLVWPALLGLAFARGRVGPVLVAVAAACLLACVATLVWLAESPDLAYALPTSWAICFVIGAATRIAPGPPPAARSRRSAGTGGSGGAQRDSIAGPRADLSSRRTGHRHAHRRAAAVVAYLDRGHHTADARPGVAGHGLLRGLPVELPAHALAPATHRPGRPARGRADPGGRGSELAPRRGAADPTTGDGARMSERLRAWSFELYAGAIVLAVGIFEVRRLAPYYPDAPYLLLVAGMVLAVALSRTAPGGALTVVWFACGLQVATEMQVMLVEGAVAVTAFGTARWGRPVVLLLSGLSIPAGGAVAALYLDSAGAAYFRLESVIDLRRLPAGSAHRRLLVGGADRALRNRSARRPLAGGTRAPVPRPGPGVTGLPGGRRGRRRPGRGGRRTVA